MVRKEHLNNDMKTKMKCFNVNYRNSGPDFLNNKNYNFRGHNYVDFNYSQISHKAKIEINIVLPILCTYSLWRGWW